MLQAISPMVQNQFDQSALMQGLRYGRRKSVYYWWPLANLAAGSRPALSLRLFERATREAPPDSRVTFRLAAEFKRTNDYEAAIKWARKTIELAPFDAGAHAFLAGLLIDLSRFPEAAEASTKALACSPDHPPFVLQGSFIALRSGQIDRLRSLAGKFLRSHANHAGANSILNECATRDHGWKR
jgi:tetratricopeptide (TPR) repeat protein